MYVAFATVPDGLHSLARLVLVLLTLLGLAAISILPPTLALGLFGLGLAVWLVVVSALPRPRPLGEYMRKQDVY